jgi:hypothetical protein
VDICGVIPAAEYEAVTQEAAKTSAATPWLPDRLRRPG